MGKQAFDGPRGQHFWLDAERVSVIGLAGKAGAGPLDTAHKKGEHPLWDERIDLPVDTALARNIRVYGVQDAVKVRKNGRYPEGHPYEGQDVIEVIEGRQRTRATRLAAQEAIKAGEVPPLLKIELEKVDELTCVGIMISLNEHRRDDLPSVRARKAARVLAMGRSEAEVAEMFGVSTQAIKQWTKFSELSPKVVKAVDAGAVSFSAAIQFAGLERDAQEAKLAELLESGVKPTVERAKTAAANGTPKPPKATKILTPKVCRMLDGHEAWIGGLSADAQALYRVLRGDTAAIAQVPGLAALLAVD